MKKRVKTNKRGKHSKAPKKSAQKVVKNKVVRKLKKFSKNPFVQRIPTLIPGFDKLVEGGVEKKSVNLVVGTSGGGKTIFAMQFLMGGIKKGENVLFVTFEEKKEEFYGNMLRFGWDLQALEKAGQFSFLEYSPERVKTMLEEGGGEIENIVIKKSIKRIVIDSITSFALLFDEEIEKREAGLALFSIIRKWDCTSLLTLEENPVLGGSGPSTSLEFEADSIILIYYVVEGAKRRRYLEVFKMRGTNHSTEIHPIRVGKNGLSVGENRAKGFPRYIASKA
jgi:circadian clock protein KaiC